MPDTVHRRTGSDDDAAALAALIAEAAEPLPDLGDPRFAAAFDRFGEARVVLLGEASHGTSEFYQARAAITRWLIERHGFTVVGVEADWPDAAVLDRHVRHLPPSAAAEPPFQRFPTWMWRNRDVASFVGWLRAHNEGLPPERRAGFHGLDMYNIGASIAAVLGFLDETDPDAAALARERYGCLSPHGHRPNRHGRGVLARALGACEQAVVAQARDLLERHLREDGEGLFDAAQNARLVASAERYYRIMHHGGAESWNLRDTHMFETLEQLLAARGPGAKAVVWAHNSHVGDARATAMGMEGGELNIGQLCRERWGDGCASIGFGTHAGTVAAASDWGGEMEVKRVRPSREGSVERACHDARTRRFLLDLRAERPVRDALLAPRLERFIGVIYRPETELMSHYAEAVLARQFDAWLWLDETTAVAPLGREPAPDGGTPETWPFGL